MIALHDFPRDHVEHGVSPALVRWIANLFVKTLSSKRMAWYSVAKVTCKCTLVNLVHSCAVITLDAHKPKAWRVTRRMHSKIWVTGVLSHVASKYP